MVVVPRLAPNAVRAPSKRSRTPRGSRPLAREQSLTISLFDSPHRGQRNRQPNSWTHWAFCSLPCRLLVGLRVVFRYHPRRFRLLELFGPCSLLPKNVSDFLTASRQSLERTACRHSGLASPTAKKSRRSVCQRDTVPSGRGHLATIKILTGHLSCSASGCRSPRSIRLPPRIHEKTLQTRPLN